MFEIATIMLFANGLALFFMVMCGSTKNYRSRTESEYRIIKEENEKSN